MTQPRKSPVPETSITEFAEIVAPKDGSEAPVVVGGHAVNLWSEYYLSKGVGKLATYMPFTSKDLDLVGSAGLLDRLYDSHKGPERKGFDQSSGRNLGNRHE